MNRRRSRALACALALALLSCAKTDAELRREDRVRLEPILVEDARAAQAMGDADRAQKKGDVIGALDAIDTHARPAIEAGLAAAARTELGSTWGRSQKELLARTLEERRAELGPYREAVVANDLEKLVAALEAQARIEQKALAAVAAVREGR